MIQVDEIGPLKSVYALISVAISVSVGGALPLKRGHVGRLEQFGVSLHALWADAELSVVFVLAAWFCTGWNK